MHIRKSLIAVALAASLASAQPAQAAALPTDETLPIVIVALIGFMIFGSGTVSAAASTKSPKVEGTPKKGKLLFKF